MAVNRTFDGALTVLGVIVPTGGISGYVPEAPNNGLAHVRLNETWATLDWSLVNGTPVVGSFEVLSTNPQLWFYDTNGPTDERTTLLECNSSGIDFAFYDDARSVGASVLKIYRSGSTLSNLVNINASKVVVSGKLVSYDLLIPSSAPPAPESGSAWFDAGTGLFQVYDGSAWVTYVRPTRSVSTQHSLTGGGDLSANRTLSLVGDSASPGNSKYYGTDGGGTKGYHDLPAAAALNTRPIAKKTATYTATSSDGIIICAFSSNGSITLPTSGLLDGQEITVIRTGGAGTVEIFHGATSQGTWNAAMQMATWIWCAADSAFYRIMYDAGT